MNTTLATDRRKKERKDDEDGMEKMEKTGKTTNLRVEIEEGKAVEKKS